MTTALCSRSHRAAHRRPMIWGLWLVLAALALTPAVADEPADAPADGPADAPADAAALGEVVAWLELSGPLPEGPPPFAWVDEEEAGPSLERVLEQLERVASQDRYKGVVVYLDQPQLTLTQINSIGNALAEVSEAGKQVLTFAEAYTMLDYLLAAEADLVLLQHRGAVELSGLSVEEIYFAGLMENIGVEADVMQIGQFKGADEPFTRNAPSEAWDQNMDALLDDLYAQIIDRIADGRDLTREQVEAVIAESWAMSDRDYMQRGVVDHLTDRDLIDVTQMQFGDDFVYEDVMNRNTQVLRQTESPFALFRLLFEERQPTTRRDSIAVIRAVGPVTSGESSYGDGLFRADAIGSRTLIQALGEVRDDPNMKAAVIRIDSPGGSALASEVIWQAVRDLGQHKPVFASIGNLAASGGYYIAAGTDEIFVSPQSIVGSIGVVGGKVVLGGLYEKVGLDVHRRSRGPLADMFNSVEPFTDEQRDAVRSGLERVYEQFLDRVELGRGNRIDNVTDVAEGRLFTGRQATANGLADEVGGLSAAIAAAADRAGLEEGQYDIVHLPPPMTLAEFLEGMFGGGDAQASMPNHAGQHVALMQLGRQLLGAEKWQSVQSVMHGIMQLRHEPALTLMPYVIVVR